MPFAFAIWLSIGTQNANAYRGLGAKRLSIEIEFIKLEMLTSMTNHWNSRRACPFKHLRWQFDQNMSSMHTSSHAAQLEWLFMKWIALFYRSWQMIPKWDSSLYEAAASALETCWEVKMIELKLLRFSCSCMRQNSIWKWLAGLFWIWLTWIGPLNNLHLLGTAIETKLKFRIIEVTKPL